MFTAALEGSVECTVDRRGGGWCWCCACLADIFLHTETKHNTTAVMTHPLNRLHFVGFMVKECGHIVCPPPLTFTVDRLLEYETPCYMLSLFFFLH